MEQMVTWIKVFFAEILLSEKKGPPPSINLFLTKNILEKHILSLIEQNLIVSCHDVFSAEF